MKTQKLNKPQPKQFNIHDVCGSVCIKCKVKVSAVPHPSKLCYECWKESKMKTVKRFLLPALVGIISSIIPRVLGFKIDTWQYWWIALPIILMSWIIYPLHEEIMRRRS